MITYMCIIYKITPKFPNNIHKQSLISEIQGNNTNYWLVAITASSSDVGYVGKEKFICIDIN